MVSGLELFFTGSNLYFTVAFVLVAALLLWRRVPFSHWGGIYVSLGILGTFYGILIALLAFNTDAVAQSVPDLIKGMKTAFATSVVGTTVAIITRLIELLRPRHAVTGAPRAQDYLAEMRAQTAALEAIKAGIGGETESSLLIQIQKLRLDMQDFMKTLSTQSTDAIIEALKGVIRDFNAKINEQFGENFKHLNEAVGRLVGWMEVHQELVTSSHAQLTAAIAAMAGAARVIDVAGVTLKVVARDIERIRTDLDQTAKTVASLPPTLNEVRAAAERLTGDAGALSENVNRLGLALQTLSEANTTLGVAITQWKELADDVPEANEALHGMVESVRLHADAVTEQQRLLVNALHSQITSLAGDLVTAQDALLNGIRESATGEMEALGAGLRASQAELLRDLSQSQKTLLVGLRKDLVGEVQALATGLRTSQTELLSQLRTALSESGTRNQEAVDKQIKALDEALERELSQALQLLGGKLGSLSQQFASDYGPLTERLAKVVQLSLALDPERKGGGRG